MTWFLLRSRVTKAKTTLPGFHGRTSFEIPRGALNASTQAQMTLLHASPISQRQRIQGQTSSHYALFYIHATEESPKCYQPKNKSKEVVEASVSEEEKEKKNVF
jgi:hypothetical protein